MSQADLFALEGNIPRFKARDRMQRWLDGEIQLSAEAIYRMVLLATDDKELAEERRLQQLTADMAARRRAAGG